ncbi:MAG TPA: hypothetical protein VLG92_01965 [Candidatus Saccharimonadia bacterium]|nr:hypothetical protein [Candidatus Saccharimonadia bacterium]
MTNRHKHRKHLHSTRHTRREPLDYIMYFFGVTTPLFELPQLWDIYSNHNADNVSLVTWGFFCIDNLAWIFYGLRKKEWPLLLTSALYEIIEIAIVIGIVRYS